MIYEIIGVCRSKWLNLTDKEITYTGREEEKKKPPSKDRPDNIANVNREGS